ncbi:MAG TPA: TrbC/VirB2 family protein [Bacillota bacterium]|nr:TrbC/VirB2 family protein [Bacillota bacterium]HOL09884.1 TrbC/VirB2 family protein [Bacillota bacterium]HPO98661.1 TrbC/VirB2 family protein [Bacillota bacterium]
MQKIRVFSKVMAVGMLLVGLMLVLSTVTLAAGSDMPWEGPLEKILNSFSGPVAKIIGTLAIISTGLGLAFGEGGGGLRKGLQIVFGLSIAFTASSFFLNFFGFSAGLPF